MNERNKIGVSAHLFSMPNAVMTRIQMHMESSSNYAFITVFQAFFVFFPPKQSWLPTEIWNDSMTRRFILLSELHVSVFNTSAPNQRYDMDMLSPS